MCSSTASAGTDRRATRAGREVSPGCITWKCGATAIDLQSDIEVRPRDINRQRQLSRQNGGRIMRNTIVWSPRCSPPGGVRADQPGPRTGRWCSSGFTTAGSGARLQGERFRQPHRRACRRVRWTRVRWRAPHRRRGLLAGQRRTRLQARVRRTRRRMAVARVRPHPLRRPRPRRGGTATLGFDVTTLRVASSRRAT